MQRLVYSHNKDEDVVEIQLSEDAVPASKMLSEIYRNPGFVVLFHKRWQVRRVELKFILLLFVTDTGCKCVKRRTNLLDSNGSAQLKNFIYAFSTVLLV